ncbi:hypothetical protein IFM89_011543 [Coptis chinensis]|uniref:RNase H type-1 domain-containing protein n=1 Tax=Coptis chinensis TaxID=261450 RepID=A0A835ISW5_9MAGN|nr:hypothetical protein IFM89_011543 [Coptis chinensis]
MADGQAIVISGLSSKESVDFDTGESVSLSSYQSWIRPPPSWCKINFEASFHSDCAHANIVVVGRNSEGEFLGGKVGRFRANTPGEAEALAVELAVDFALQKQWKEVILEGDAKMVIQACRNIEAITSWT